jgi:hypothetical protein
MESTNDVYAGDHDIGNKRRGLPLTEAYGFEIIADADPDTLIRFAAQFVLSNKLPDRFDFSRIADGRVKATVELSGITDTLAESIRRKLEQLSCTETVRLWKL